MAVRLRCVWVASLCLLPAVSVSAQTPLGTDFTYQGQLKASGLPALASADFQFLLFDALSNGTQIGPAQSRDNVALVNGAFTISLDFGAAAFQGDARWLQVAVRSPAGAGGFTTLAPRQLLTATPNATYSLQTRGIAVDETGHVGVGTTTPVSNLHVFGADAALRLQDDDNATSFALLDDQSPGQMRLNKVSDATISLIDINPMPVNGTSDAAVRFFRETSTTGLRRVFFHSGNNSAATSAVIGVGGSSSVFQLDGGNFGIGTPTPTNRLSVAGRTDITGSVGIGTTAPSEGKLHVETTGLVAVHGNATSQGPFGECIGGRFISSGEALCFGVWGEADGASDNYGVFGVAFDEGLAVFASGNFAASGTKAFRIDHPLDPENKYLLHYCAEGPEPQNIYNGTVRTDSQGGAAVELPSYFEEINKDFRYQLTCVGTFAQAIVAEEISGNRFLIRTDKPNVKVCWEVKGVRNDLYVRTRGAHPVVKDKQGRERGTYQHPELYGQPEEKGLYYRPTSEVTPPVNAPHCTVGQTD